MSDEKLVLRNVTLLVDCEGKQIPVIENLRAFIKNEMTRKYAEQRIGRLVLDLMRGLEVGRDA